MKRDIGEVDFTWDACTECKFEKDEECTIGDTMWAEKLMIDPVHHDRVLCGCWESK